MTCLSLETMPYFGKDVSFVYGSARVAICLHKYNCVGAGRHAHVYTRVWRPEGHLKCCSSRGV